MELMSFPLLLLANLSPSSYPLSPPNLSPSAAYSSDGLALCQTLQKKYVGLFQGLAVEVVKYSLILSSNLSPVYPLPSRPNLSPSAANSSDGLALWQTLQKNYVGLFQGLAVEMMKYSLILSCNLSPVYPLPSCPNLSPSAAYSSDGLAL